jgi:hypothetical protein
MLHWALVLPLVAAEQWTLVLPLAAAEQKAMVEFALALHQPEQRSLEMPAGRLLKPAENQAKAGYSDLICR